MLIYCNGDSFMSGHGLADADRLPGYDSISMLRGDAYRTAKNNIIKTATDTGLTESMSEGEKARAYPATLAKLLNATVINSSSPGASNSAILYSTMLDIADLIKRGTKPDLVIFGITMSGRISLFNHRSTSPSQRIPSFLLSAKQPLVEHAELLKWYSLCQTAEDDDFRALTEIALLNSFIHSTLGYYPVLVPALPYSYIKNTNFNSTISIMYELSRVAYIPESLHESTHRVGECLPCGHFSQQTVDTFASILADHIKTLLKPT